MRIAVYGKSFGRDHTEHIRKLFDLMHNAGAEVLVYNGFIPHLEQLGGYTFSGSFSTYKDLGDIDFIISIGGDGTLLDTARFIRDRAIPVVGINTGRLGYLSSIGSEKVETCFQNLVNDVFDLNPRTMLEIQAEGDLFRDENMALNDITLHKMDNSAMITVNAYLNGRFLNNYWADGLIVSTPTGSTAYSMSCGGPIVLPGSGNFVLTPVAPHNLNVRPIVIPDNSMIKLKVEGRSKTVLVTLDSRSHPIEEGMELRIQKYRHPFNLVRFPGSDDLQTIRKKLNWGFDRRN